MILTCQSCGTRYQTDRARFIPSGCNVRCAKCGHVWFQPSPDGAAEPRTDIAADAHESASVETPSMTDIPFSRARQETVSAAEKRERRFSIANLAAWAALVLLVAAIGWAVVQYRQSIAELWPQSATFYAALGMPVNVRGLEIDGLSYKQEVEDGQPVLSISGRIVNITAHEIAVPALHASLSDNAKHELYRWNFDTGVATLKPGADAPFMTRLMSPPAEARMVDVRFAQAGER